MTDFEDGKEGQIKTSSYTYVFKVQLKTKEIVCAHSLPHTLGSLRICRVENGALSSLQGIRSVDCEGRHRKLCFPRCYQGKFVPSTQFHHLGLFSTP